MLGLVFTVLLAVFVIKAIVLAVRLAWGIIKVLACIVFFPFILIGLVTAGLMTVALPIIIIAAVIILLVKA